MIGIFDSGIGGLSVFREILKILPEQRYIYYSDNANCPYGEKSEDFIIERARFITSFLISKGADIIVIACNTATAAAISILRKEFPINFIGMEPAVKPAAKCTKTGVVGVLATSGTLKAEKYRDTRERFAYDIRIVEHVGNGFVELVECGKTSGTETEAIVEKSLRPLLEEGADTIVLGCTHYPFLSGAISNVASKVAQEREVMIIDPAPAVARHLLEIMQEEGLPSSSPEGFGIELHASGQPDMLIAMYDRLKDTEHQ